jgi:general secretion pathway protein N
VRSEAIGPRTWLLLALAGWAVLAWLLALAGMGSRIVPLPDDPGLVQALPVLPAPVPERLGPLSQYAQISHRPVFAADRQPHPFFLEGQGGEQADKGFDYVLTSVLITPRVRLAILQAPGEGNAASAVSVKLGEAPPSASAWRLTELAPRRAVFEGPEGQRTLELRVFDGQGGQAPTQLTSALPQGQAPRQPPRQASTQGRPVDAPAPPRERPSSSDPQVRGAPASTAADAAAAGADAAAAPQTTEQQMQAIRERIEARRRQMREQQNSGAPGTTK